MRGIKHVPTCKDFVEFMVKEEHFPIDHVHSTHKYTLLMLAVRGDNALQNAELLLSLGANPLVNIGEEEDVLQNVADAIAVCGSADVFKMLLAKNEEFAKEYSSNDIKFELAAAAILFCDNLQQQKSFIQLLIDTGFSINHISSIGQQTLLMFAAFKNLPTCAEYLIALGADIVIKSVSRGKSTNDAAEIAAARGALEVFNVIKSHSSELQDFATNLELQFRFLAIAALNIHPEDVAQMAQNVKFIRTIVQETHFPMDYNSVSKDLLGGIVCGADHCDDVQVAEATDTFADAHI